MDCHRDRCRDLYYVFYLFISGLDDDTSSKSIKFASNEENLERTASADMTVLEQCGIDASKGTKY